MRTKIEQFLNKYQVGLKDPIKWVDWGLPLAIPLIQWTQQQKAYTRELLIRDLLSFVTGSLVYLLALPIIEMGIRKARPQYAPRLTQFLASTGAVTLFIGFAGICGPRLSQWIEGRLQSQDAQPSPQPSRVLPPPPQAVVPFTPRPTPIQVLPLVSPPIPPRASGLARPLSWPPTISLPMRPASIS